MNTKNRAILVLVISLAISGCGQKQLIEPTPTSSLIPTQTSTPASAESQIIFVPRLMLIGQEGSSLEILGEKWDYVEDNFSGEEYACRLFSREDGTSIYLLKQCYYLVEGTNAFEDQVASYKNNKYELLIPNNTSSEIGQISLFGKKDSALSYPYEYVEIIGAEKYFFGINLLIKSDEDSPLQVAYKGFAANIIDYLAEDSIQKFHTIGLTSTYIPPSTTTIINAKDVSQGNTTLDSSKGHIEGNISWVNPQKPIKNASIEIYKAGSNSPGISAKTDAKGYYTFVNIEPSEYGFAINIIIPSSEMVCKSSDVLFDVDLNWLHFARAYNDKNEWVDVWLSINNVAVQAGKIIYVDAVLKCP